MSMNHKSNDCTLEDLFNLFEDNIAAEDILSARILGKISSIITKKRLCMQMNQKEFAHYLNVSQSMVSKWEGSDYNYTIKTLAHLFTKLDMDFDVRIVEKFGQENFQQLSRYTDSTSTTSIYIGSAVTDNSRPTVYTNSHNAYSSVSYKSAIGG